MHKRDESFLGEEEMSMRKLDWALQKHGLSHNALLLTEHVGLASVPATGDAPKAISKSQEGSFWQQVQYSMEKSFWQSPVVLLAEAAAAAGLRTAHTWVVWTVSVLGKTKERYKNN